MATVKLTELADAIRKQTIGKYMVALEKTIPRWQTTAQAEIKGIITDLIQQGQSPVRDRGRYQDYSSLYKHQITNSKKLKALGKKLRPVNLTLTGKMLRSIKTRAVLNGIAVWFTDEKAKYHDKLGAGKSKVIRKMLPSEKGQEFTRVIDKKLKELLQLELSQQLKKNQG